MRLNRSILPVSMVFIVSGVGKASPGEFPISLDLRNIGGGSLVSSVKSQSGGTCWTHATAAAVESNLIKSSEWLSQGESGEPNIAEYHLDWWNGFNKHFNADTAPEKNGLTVHQGGDFLVAAAYLARGGAVRDVDGQSYSRAPSEAQSSYHYYYPRHIEWLASDDRVDARERIKTALTNHGVVATALTWSSKFYNSGAGTFYQPASSGSQPNHAVAIAGWDDNKRTQASKPGAWLIKNSWGSGWGKNGYFWISYEDKITANHPEMGAVSFRDVERFAYNRIYYHDYHGWRGTKKDVLQAFNAFAARGPSDNSASGSANREYLKAVSFYTTEHDSDYTIRVYKGFSDGALSDEVASASGREDNKGFHTIDLPDEIGLDVGEMFYVSVELSKGGHAYDKTSNVPVLLCGNQTKTIVKSKASPGQSYYLNGDRWVDLTTDDATANFAIKALTVFH